MRCRRWVVGNSSTSFYREATRKPYSFLYIRLDQPEPMFMERFDFVLEP
jgi:hypothetical protein